MMDSNKDYVSKLDAMKLFPSQSFYQIQLDVPRLNMSEHRKKYAS